MPISSAAAAIQTIGKPCSPGELFRAISSREAHLIEQFAYLSNITAHKSPTGASYCFPGRRWLAARLGVSISTVSRYTSHLKALGVLRKFQRRPDLGKWQTNIYVLVGPAARLVARVMHPRTAPPNRVAESAHKPPSEGKDSRQPDGRTALRAIIRNLEERLRGG